MRFAIVTFLLLWAAGYYFWDWMFSGLPDVEFGGQEQQAQAAEQWPDLGPLKGEPETVSLVRESWEKVKSHCPGFKRYGADLEFAGLKDMTGMGDGMGRVEILFRVADQPVAIPSHFQAQGHRCGYGLSPDGRTLRIQREQ